MLILKRRALRQDGRRAAQDGLVVRRADQLRMRVREPVVILGGLEALEALASLRGPDEAHRKAEVTGAAVAVIALRRMLAVRRGGRDQARGDTAGQEAAHP